MMKELEDKEPGRSILAKKVTQMYKLKFKA